MHDIFTLWKPRDTAKLTYFIFFGAWLSAHVLHVLSPILNKWKWTASPKSTSMITWLILGMSVWDIHLSPRLNSPPSVLHHNNTIDFQMSSCHFCLPGTDRFVLCGNTFKHEVDQNKFWKQAFATGLVACTDTHTLCSDSVSCLNATAHTATLPVCGNEHTFDF